MGVSGTPTIEACELPRDALLGKYRGGGGYADCYVTEVPWRVSHAEFVEAFYTTALFGIERRLLSWFISKPSTDAEARRLATGALNSFAAWRVEARGTDQLLLCDYQGHTRSWLMVAPATTGAVSGTRLYFGSAVVPVASAKSGEPALGATFRLLLDFHKLYSRALLRAARARLTRTRAAHP